VHFEVEIPNDLKHEFSEFLRLNHANNAMKEINGKEGFTHFSGDVNLLNAIAIGGWLKEKEIPFVVPEDE